MKRSYGVDTKHIANIAYIAANEAATAAINPNISEIRLAAIAAVAVAKAEFEAEYKSESESDDESESESDDESQVVNQISFRNPILKKPLYSHEILTIARILAQSNSQNNHINNCGLLSNIIRKRPMIEYKTTTKEHKKCMK
jgi:hypothetical protein